MIWCVVYEPKDFWGLLLGLLHNNQSEETRCRGLSESVNTPEQNVATNRLQDPAQRYQSEVTANLIISEFDDFEEPIYSRDCGARFVPGIISECNRALGWKCSILLFLFCFAQKVRLQILQLAYKDITAKISYDVTVQLQVLSIIRHPCSQKFKRSRVRLTILDALDHANKRQELPCPQRALKTTGEIRLISCYHLFARGGPSSKAETDDWF